MAHILLIEDDPHQVALVQRWLGEHDLTVVTHGGEVEAALGFGWDLVISDVQLPGADGIELLRSRGQAVPTLVITSHTDFHVALDAMRAGAADLLAKPFTRSQLESAVGTLLARKNARRRRVLAIGAHPDDVEIGVGGTLARHGAAGDALLVLTLSRGAAGGETETRAEEALRAAALLGATLRLEDLPDTRLGGPDVIAAIERAIREFRPDIVYTHSHNDRHQDHRAVHEATCIAARNVPSVYAYQAPSTTIDFRPSKFVDITETMDRKLEAIGAYASQAGRAYMTPETLRSTAAYWGRFAQYGQVEPLEVHREATFVV